MRSVTIQIGNSDDKLTQTEWSKYVHEVSELVVWKAVEVHFFGCSPSDREWQNACWAITVEANDVDSLRSGLARIRATYRQDSVAFTTGTTEFV